MKMLKSKTWQHEVTGSDGNVILFGVNIFDYEWKNTHKSVKVRDPLYGQEYKFPIYPALLFMLPVTHQAITYSRT